VENHVTLYLFCGKMAAGKSTLAAKLSKELGVVLLSEDDLLTKLYPGEITDIPTYVERSERLKIVVEDMLLDLLSHGVPVILDFPANTAKQRAHFAEIAKQANASHELHYINLSDSACKSQLLMRASESQEKAPTDTLAMFDAITKYFEPPSENEGLNIVIDDRNNN